MTASLHDASDLLAIPFVNLLIGPDFAELSSVRGAPDRIVDVPGKFGSEVQALRTMCVTEAQTVGPEFTVTYGDERFRVTTVDEQAGTLYVLARMNKSVRPLLNLGLPRPLVDHLCSRELQGMVIVSGDMEMGKTTTADSIFVHRLQTYGGLGLAIADPPETALSGKHGPGRAAQVPVTRDTYRDQLTRTLRSRAEIVYIGEVRDPETAWNVLEWSGSGFPVVLTMHSPSPERVFTKYQALCARVSVNAVNSMLADNVSCVIHQELTESHSGGDRQLVVDWLLVSGEKSAAIQSHIRKGEFSALASFRNQQRNQTINGGRFDPSQPWGEFGERRPF